MEESGQALPAGTRLEEFQIESVLGSGGFGITYLARDTSLGRRVVIKENLPVQFCYRDTRSLTVSPRSTRGEDADSFRWSLENFSREAETLASLDHPGIVRVLRRFDACGTSYFVMPFVEGQVLEDWLLSGNTRGGYPDETILREVLIRLLDALTYLHGHRIYHRDLKPANILMTRDGRPVLIDFGAARQRLSERSLTVIESAGYTPFEQLQSRGDVGPWSDLYALGATMAKAITGAPPPKTMDRMVDDPWIPLLRRSELQGRYTPTFLEAIDRALKVSPKVRWQSAGQWEAGLRGETGTSPARVAKENPVRRSSDVPQSPRVMAATALAREGVNQPANGFPKGLLVLFLMVIAAGWGVWVFGRSNESGDISTSEHRGDLVDRSSSSPSRPDSLASTPEPTSRRLRPMIDPEPAPAPAPEPPPILPAPEPAPATPPVGPTLSEDGIVKAMQNSIKRGEIKEFLYSQVVAWKAGSDETIGGALYQTGEAAYKADTIFGPKTLQAKALIKDGEVVKWVWKTSEMEIK